MQELVNNEQFEKNVLDDGDKKDHKTINFYLPHEFGGCGEPIQQELFGMFNRYKPDMDLAKINPRWTTKHEFMVDLPKNTALEEAMEDPVDEIDPQNSSMLRPAAPSLSISKNKSYAGDKYEFVNQFEKTVLKEFEKKTMPTLEEKLRIAKAELYEEEKKCRVIEEKRNKEYQNVKHEELRRLDIEK